MKTDLESLGKQPSHRKVGSFLGTFALAGLIGASILMGLEGDRLRASGFAAPPLTPGVIIDNGTVQLGIHQEGHLNIPGGTPSWETGTTVVGLRYVPTNAEATSPGCFCEGWGVADTISGVSGYANEHTDGGAVNLSVQSFVTNSIDAATSTVHVGSTFEVIHDYYPSAVTPYLYRVDVSIKNISAQPTDVRYRRVLDMDVEPTAFIEYITIQGSSVSNMEYASDDGFATANPLGAASSICFTGDAVDSGPEDHGALFQFDFGMLAPQATWQFRTYYGAAGNEADALGAISAVGAEVYALGQPATNPAVGTPNTFIFAFGGVGEPVPCVPPPPDLTAWWTFDESVGTVANDIVGGNDGALVGSFYHSPGLVKRGLYLFSQGARVEVPASPANVLGTGDFTFDAWVHLETADDVPILAKMEDPSFPGTGYVLYLQADGQLVFHMRGATEVWATAAGPVPESRWTFVAVAVDRDQSNGGRIYVNDQVTVFDPTPVQDDLTNAELLLFGYYPPTGANAPYEGQYTGQIDEIELFGAALSEADILSVYEAGFRGKCKSGYPGVITPIATPLQGQILRRR